MGILFSIDQFDVSEIQVLLIIDVNVRKLYIRLNYSQINQLCRIIQPCVWTIFHCMLFVVQPLECLATTAQMTYTSLRPAAAQNKKRVGLRDREMHSAPPNLSLPSPLTAGSSLVILAAMQSRVSAISQHSPLDGST